MQDSGMSTHQHMTAEELFNYRTGYYWDEEETANVVDFLPPHFTAIQAVEFLQKKVSAEHRMWLYCHSRLLSSSALRNVACDWTERAFRLAGCNELKARIALYAVRKYAQGKVSRQRLHKVQDMAVALSEETDGFASSAATALVATTSWPDDMPFLWGVFCDITEGAGQHLQEYFSPEMSAAVAQGLVADLEERILAHYSE
jgi:hypothetical protein